MTQFIPHTYQKICLDHLRKTKKAALFLDCGMGKTVIAETYLFERIYEYFDEDINRILVIAPKKVAEDTWTQEVDKWDHLKPLRFSKVLGTKKQRLKGLEADADIYLINRENVAWLVDGYGDRWPFDAIIVDELSSFKGSDSDRFRALKQVVDSGKVKCFIGLTGTPQPRGLEDLWSQMYLIDGGQRLGATLEEFHERYFSKELKDNVVRTKAGDLKRNVYWEYTPLPGSDVAIQDKIRDIVISLTAEDWLSVPEAISVYRHVNLSKSDLQKVKYFTRERVLALEDATITAGSAAQVALKLMQIANGAIYDEEHNVIDIHDSKLDELEAIVEEANGAPVMVFYWFQHDKDRILKRFKKKKRSAKDKLVISDLKSSKDRTLWNERKIDIALCHPASMGHGLNLQKGGNIIVWYSMTFDLEIYIQANKRLHRQGQSEKVLIHHIICNDTYDEEAVERLKEKDGSQRSLIESLKARLKHEHEEDQHER